MRLAATHGLSAICINAPPNTMPLETAIVELRQLAAVASHYGVTLCLETHLNCHTEIPAVAVQLAESAPHLGLALDPSHYYAGPWQGRDFSATYPHTRIVHLRDAGNTPDKNPGAARRGLRRIRRNPAEVSRRVNSQAPSRWNTSTRVSRLMPTTIM